MQNFKKEGILTPKVSIIVPVYNTEKYLSKCLMSLSQQTLKDIEIIIVNDGSTDNSLFVISEFAKEDCRIKVMSQKNKLQGAARNNGTKIATGEYIGFVDSDDWIDNDYYEKLYAAAKKYDSDIALATSVRIGHGRTKKRLNITKEEFVRGVQEKFDICRLAKNPCPTNKIYKREMLIKNNLKWPEGCYCEDKLFVTQAVYYANGVVSVPGVNYYYFRNPHSTVNSKNKKYFNKLNKDKDIAKCHVLNFLKEKNPNIRDKDFWAVTDEYRVFNIPLYKIKSSIKTERLYILGLIPIAGICDTVDYKHKQVNFCGIKLTYKTNNWKNNANEQNILLNKSNLSFDVDAASHNILFVASNFMEAGGIETRLLQYINALRVEGRNVYILSEYNANKLLLELINFKLNFDAENFGCCLEEIVDKYNINTVEFQFKNPKILKNLDIDKLKLKVKLGCTIHNLGISNANIINKFDYKIMVSKYMYENYYAAINNADVIQNCIDTDKYKNLPFWEYKGQKKALLISRINTDKIKSIECFIQYCKLYNIEFEIAGEEQCGSNLKQKLIKKYRIDESVFIGNVDTFEYLSQHVEDILFVGGVGLVILEAAYLNYPCMCCSEWENSNYSFVTLLNIDLFDNFTIRSHSLVTRNNKKEFVLNLESLNLYQLRNYITCNRDLKIFIEKYLKIIEGKNV